MNLTVYLYRENLFYTPRSFGWMPLRLAFTEAHCKVFAGFRITYNFPALKQKILQ